MSTINVLSTMHYFQSSPIPPMGVEVSFRHGSDGVDAHEGFSRSAAVFHAPEFRPDFTLRPRILDEGIREKGFTLKIFNGFDIHIMVGDELLGLHLGAAGSLAEVEAETHAALQPRVVSEIASRPV